ncbi:hypothetical protein SISNIDRAFT_480906 [Sistotremastrum niveocremeum HHB9708]|uniref:Serine aminopeptidase S33 domain-containing protein n=1 Tax=Sistotremastrum niveocremeum HHB9708 TaxID=1314777 RepID=A0A164ZVF7_9AGAM|nr:hypothetical protein SISNIDRAFT_480906 [Sistotremastrum niveocremeum HHB9708]
MGKMLSQYLLSLFIAFSSFAAAQTCTSLTIPVNIEAQTAHITIPEPVDQSALTAFFVNLSTHSIDYPNTIINGTRQLKAQYKIAGKLCTPKNVKPNGTLEFATHGVAFTHAWWEVDGDNSEFNYAAKAVASGHSIFYYDRLGTGFSSQPDGIQEVQSTVQVEIAHALVQYLRQGKTGHKFGKVIGVGHSFGSVITVGVTVKYPKDFDDVVLTGFAIGDPVAPFVGAASFGAAIASEAIPTLNTPSSYVVPGTISSYQANFLQYPNYDPAVIAAQFKIRGTATLGEFTTLTTPVAPATDFTGRVLVVTGITDSFFCGGNCAEKINGTTPPNLVAGLYPATSNFSSYVPLNTGHGINVHFSAPTTYDIIEKWIGA